jgi:hypothetical protein
MTSANVVYNGKNYYVPAIEKTLRGYIKITIEGNSISINKNNCITNELSAINNRVFISKVNIIKEIEEGRAISAPLDTSNDAELQAEKEDRKNKIKAEINSTFFDKVKKLLRR